MQFAVLVGSYSQCCTDMTQYDASSMEDAALLLLKDCCLQAGVDGEEYMPATSIQKRSHPWQGWKSLGVQGNPVHDQLFTHQSSFVFNVWVRMMKES